MPQQRRRRRLLFAAVPSVVMALVVLLAYWAYLEPEYQASLQPRREQKRGQGFNLAAWRAAFNERGLAVPAGPRDGVWQRKLPKRQRLPDLGWRESPVRIEGLLDVDREGLQHYRPTAPPIGRVLILGGSVAFGAYASSIDRTYFHRLGVMLEERGAPADLVVLAAGAWKSSQDLIALQTAGPGLRPDLVVMLNGLNDLTNGATAEGYYKEVVTLPSGEQIKDPQHAHDYARRAALYLENVGAAADWARSHGAELLVVLQPSLAERSPLTRHEAVLLKGSLRYHTSRAAIVEAYGRMRTGLGRLARAGGLEFLDGSRAFNGEATTSFADMWHFADPSHEILAAQMAPRIAKLLESPRLQGVAH